LKGKCITSGRKGRLGTGKGGKNANKNEGKDIGPQSKQKGKG